MIRLLFIQKGTAIMTKWAETNIQLLIYYHCINILIKALQLLHGILSYHMEATGQHKWTSAPKCNIAMFLLKVYLARGYADVDKALHLLHGILPYHMEATGQHKWTSAPKCNIAMFLLKVYLAHAYADVDKALQLLHRILSYHMEAIGQPKWTSVPKMQHSNVFTKGLSCTWICRH
jgi:hypothetical protein